MVGGMIMIGDTIMRRWIWMTIHFGVIGGRWRRRLSMIAIGIVHSLLFCATTSGWHSFCKMKFSKFSLSLSLSCIRWFVHSAQIGCVNFMCDSWMFSLQKKICEIETFFMPEQFILVFITFKILPVSTIWLYFSNFFSFYCRFIYFSTTANFSFLIFVSSRDCCCIVVYVLLLPSSVWAMVSPLCINAVVYMNVSVCDL